MHDWSELEYRVVATLKLLGWGLLWCAGLAATAVAWKFIADTEWAARIAKALVTVAVAVSLARSMGGWRDAPNWTLGFTAIASVLVVAFLEPYFNYLMLAVGVALCVAVLIALAFWWWKATTPPWRR